MVKERFFWVNMNVDVSKWAKSCIKCQRAKVHRHTKSKISQFPLAERFTHIHVDIVGPLPISLQDYRYLVTIVDRQTGWPEAFPVKDITAETVAKVIVEGWISRFGCPAKLTTDQGRQFESNVFKELMKCLGIVKTRTTPYHPQCNGLVERWHRSLKAALMARLDSKTWVEELPIVLLGLRAAPRTDSGVSAAEMTYGQTLRLPGDFYNDGIIPILDHCQYVKHLRAMIYNLKPKPLPRKDAHTVFVHSDLNNCTHVFVRSDIIKKSLEPPYEGPYKVLNRTEKVFLVQFPNRDAYISVDRLKPAYMHTAETENNLVIKNNLSTDRLKISDHNKEPIGTSENSDQNRSANYRVTRSGRIVKPPVRFAD